MDLDVVQGVRKTTLENIVMTTVTKISSNTSEIRKENAGDDIK